MSEVSIYPLEVSWFKDVIWQVHNKGVIINHVRGETVARSLLDGNANSHYGVIIKKTGLYFKTGPNEEEELELLDD